MEHHIIQTRADPARHFRTDHLKANLKSHSVRGGAAILFAQACKFLIQLGATVALARLLTPEDYGLFAMVLAVVTFVSLFKDTGLSTAIVQSIEINHRQVSTLFWINAALGVTLALVTAAAAPIISWFYGEPRLIWSTLALASVFIFAGLGSQHRALLRRQMRFYSLVTIEIASMAIGFTTAIILAWHGVGYWALVFMLLAMEMSHALGLWLACDWRPGRPVRHSGVRSMLRFGGQLTGFYVLLLLNRSFDSLLIGRYWGAQQLGLYDKAYQSLFLPVQQISLSISGVVLPVLSRLQGDPRRYRDYHTKSLLLFAGFSMPLVAFLFVTADSVIPLILGTQWVSTVPLFRALAPVAFLHTFYAGVSWIFISLGHTGRQLRWNLGVTILTLMSTFIGVRWGAIGVAVAFSSCRVGLSIPTLLYCCKDSPLRWTELVKTASRPALAATLAAILLTVIRHPLPIIPSTTIDLLTSGVFYGLLYLAVWMALPNGRQVLLETTQLIKVLWRKQEEAH